MSRKRMCRYARLHHGRKTLNHRYTRLHHGRKTANHRYARLHHERKTANHRYARLHHERKTTNHRYADLHHGRKTTNHRYADLHHEAKNAGIYITARAYTRASTRARPRIEELKTKFLIITKPPWMGGVGGRPAKNLPTSPRSTSANCWTASTRNTASASPTPYATC